MDVQKKSPFVRITVFVLFGLLIASFALWGIGDIFRTGTKVTVVATVGDQEIGAEAFARALRRTATDMQRDAGGNLPQEELLAAGLVDRALRPMLQRALFSQLAEDMGLALPNELVLASIQQEAAFQGPDGRFSQNAYFEALRRADLTESDYVALVKEDLQRNYLIGAYLAQSQMPESEALALYGFLDEKRIAQYLVIGKDRYSDVGEPDATQLEALYNEKIDQYQAPEYRAVTLLHLKPEDFLGEIQITEDDLKKRFEDSKQDYVQPEQRRLNQIVLADQAAAEAALAEAKAGKSLEQVAEEQGLGSVISLGLLTKEKVAGLIPELADAAFNLPAGETFGITESVLGWHLFEVAEIVAGKEPTFEEVRAALEEDTKMSLAVEAMGSLASQVDQELTSGATFDEMSSRLALPLRTIEAIDSYGRDRSGTPLVGLPSPTQFLREIFSAEPGLESLLVEADDGSFFAYRVDGITPPAARPLGEVRDSVVALWQDGERQRLANEEATKIADRLNAGETIDAIAAELGLKIETTEAINRFESAPSMTPSAELSPKLFTIEPGKAITANSDQGAVVAKLQLVIAADPSKDPERVALVRDSFDSSWRSDLVQQILGSLQQTYPIEVNQAVIDQILAQF